MRIFLNMLLLFSSLGLHALLTPKTLPALLSYIFLAHFFGFFFSLKKGDRRIWLLLGIALHILVFVLLKDPGRILHLPAQGGEPSALPVEKEHLILAFILLHALSYLVRIYRGEAEANRNLLDVALYLSVLSFLPIRPLLSHEWLKRQREERKIEGGVIARGIYLLLIGAAKQMILVKSFALIADTVFLMTKAGHLLMEIPLLLAWVGFFAFALQMFYTFSAYSDLSVGFLALFGIELKKDFGFPYAAASLAKYWMGWQSSVKDFFYQKGFLFFGENKKKKNASRFYSYMLSGALFGAWFGFSLRFVLWATLFSLFLAFEEIVFDEERESQGGALMHLPTLAGALLGWLLIRTENYYHFKEYFGNLFLQNGNEIFNPYVWMFFREYIWFWMIGILGCIDPRAYQALIRRFRYERGESRKKRRSAISAKRWQGLWQGAGALFLLLLIPIYLFGGGELNSRLPGRIRYPFLEAYGSLQKILGKQEIKGFSVVRDKKGILYESSFWNGFASDKREFVRKIRVFKDNLDKEGTKVGMVIYPTKLLWKEYGYAGIPYRDDTIVAEEIKSWMNYYKIPVLDLQFMGRDENAMEENFFYTDEYWSPKGAFKGYVHILAWMKESFGQELDPKNSLRDIASYRIEKEEEGRLGEQGKKTGFFYARRADHDIRIEPLHPGSYTVRYENQGSMEELSGSFGESLMGESKSLFAYGAYERGFNEGYLRGGRYRYISILNQEETKGKSLLLIKDGNAAPIGAFLAQSFARVDLLEVTMIEEGEIGKLLEENHYDYVLITLGAKQLVETRFEF